MYLTGYCIPVLLLVLVFSQEAELVPLWTTEPSSPSFAIEGDNITLHWSYNLQGTLRTAKLNDIRGGGAGELIAQKLQSFDTAVASNYQARFRINISDTEASMTILALQRSDTGTYRYEVTNDQISKISSDVKISVQYPPSILDIFGNKTVNENDLVTLNCTADSNPQANITWTTVPGNSYVIFPLTITGKQDEGYYRCTADNGVGIPASDDVFITVQKFHPTNTQLTTSSQNYIANLAEAFNITCSAEANPPAQYLFFREQERVFDDTSGVGVYTIHVSDRVPKVIYRCIPYNGFGDGPVKNMTVTVHYPPYITKPQTKISRVRAGSTTNISCIANGNPAPITTWINATTGAAVGSGGILSFNPATESDSGSTFICTADNGIEPAASSNISLIVGDDTATIVLKLPAVLFLSAYQNVSSNEYKSLILRILKWLRDVEGMNNTVETIQVYELSEGSVIANLMLKFKLIVHVESVISALRFAAEHGNMSDLKVDPNSIRVVQGNESTATLEPIATSEKGSDGPPWLIIGIVLGVAAVLVILVCCVYKCRS